MLVETHATTESRNKATIKRSFNAWKEGSGSHFDLLSDDATWTIVGLADHWAEMLGLEVGQVSEG